MEYASNAKGNLGVTLGAVGTGLNLLTGGIGLMNAGCNMNNMNRMGYGNCHVFNDYVTKDELRMSQEISAKDSQIALISAELDSEKKMIEVYKQTRSDIKELQDEVRDNRKEQDVWNTTQAVNNAHMSAAIAANRMSIESLQNCCNSITQLKIPNSAVCPGWGDIKVSPVPATTTAVQG